MLLAMENLTTKKREGGKIVYFSPAIRKWLDDLCQQLGISLSALMKQGTIFEAIRLATLAGVPIPPLPKEKSTKRK